MSRTPDRRKVREARQIVWSFAIVGVVVLGAAPAPGQAGGADNPGLAALDRGEAAAARPALAEAAAEALFHLALAEQGEARQTALDKAKAVAPEGSWVRSAADGAAALAGEKPADAASAFRAALAKHPDKRVQKLLGDALREQDDIAGALSAYGSATAMDPSYAPALSAVGDLERRRGDFAAAFNAYNHALDAEGRPFGALIGRATSRHYLGDKDGTLADLALAERVARTPSERARAQMSVFYVNAYWRTLPRGLDAAERAVAIWEGEGRADSAASLCNAVGRVLLETGDPPGAASWYERGWQIVSASSLEPGAKTIWQVRKVHGAARIAAQRRDFRRADALAAEARVLMDGDAANVEHYRLIYPYLVGYIRLQERQYDEAVALLKQAETEQAFIQYLLAESYARSRNRAEARAWYEKALASSAGLDTESVIVRPLAQAWLTKNPAGS